MKIMKVIGKIILTLIIMALTVVAPILIILLIMTFPQFFMTICIVTICLMIFAMFYIIVWGDKRVWIEPSQKNQFYDSRNTYVDRLAAEQRQKRNMDQVMRDHEMRERYLYPRDKK